MSILHFECQLIKLVFWNCHVFFNWFYCFSAVQVPHVVEIIFFFQFWMSLDTMWCSGGCSNAITLLYKSHCTCVSFLCKALKVIYLCLDLNIGHITISLYFSLVFSSSELYDFYHYFYMLTNVLFYVSSAINPVLYNLVSATYRQIFFSTLRYFCMPCRHTNRNQPYPLNRHSISISSSHTLSTNIIKETAYWLSCR